MITNTDGQFSLEIPEDARILVFSFVGMISKEINLNNQTEINVSLSADNFGVGEVVVSALGIKRAEKALTYSTQTIQENDITGSKDINFVNSLSGKISGIEINKSAAGAGGSSKIILRGNKSLSTSSDPLFVIDGVPMANNKGSQLGLWGGYDGGDGLSQINPEDIESISVLKGANAAALYGSQGANGVIIVTTKKGEKGDAKISLSSGITFETIMNTPKLQYRYGSVNEEKESWSNIRGDYSNNFVNDFFRTGSNLINSFTVSSGNDRTTTYFSYANTATQGVVPKNSYQKNNLSFTQSTQLCDDKLIVNSHVLLTDERTKNRNTAGYYLNPLTGLYLFPRDKDYSSYAQNYQVFDPNRNMYLQNWFVSDHFQSNPEWIINNERKLDLTKRSITSVLLEYKIRQNLGIQVRGDYDYAIRSHEQQNKAGSNLANVHPNGSWIFQKYTDELIYTDAILSFNQNFGLLSLNAVLGTSYEKSKYGVGVSVDTGTDGLKYPNVFSFQNISTTVMVNSIYGSSMIKEAAFSNVQLGYKDMFYLDISGRNDWASSLIGTGNDSYFYPAFGLTTLINEMIKFPEFISFAKARISYSVVANEVPFNKISPNNTITKTGISFSTTKPFTNLKPEMLRSLEVGTDWRFMNGKMGLELTFYDIDSRDQFIALPAPSGSGYTQYFVNAGQIVNKGVELTVNAEPVKKKGFSWTSNLNYANNRNKIVSLHPDLKNPISLKDDEGYQLIIKEGGSFGDLYVYKFLRDSQGRIRLNDKGEILKTDKKEYVGNSNPNWSLGWNNSFTFRNLTLEMLFNGKFGGKVISQTEAMLDGYGVSERSGAARDNGGVAINAVMPDGTPVTTMNAKQYYTSVGDRNGIKEVYTYNRTNIRLAQFNISYDFLPSKSVVKHATFSIIAQNLLFLFKNAPFDPEITMNTLLVDQALDNFVVPSTRTVGVNLKVSF
jgi:TonB-linked SusC/RagA family outer membrane protein